MMFKRIVLDEYYLFSKSDGYSLSCGRVIIAMAADDVTKVNFGFKQFMTTVVIYAATNLL